MSKEQNKRSSNVVTRFLHDLKESYNKQKQEILIDKMFRQLEHTVATLPSKYTSVRINQAVLRYPNPPHYVVASQHGIFNIRVIRNKETSQILYVVEVFYDTTTQPSKVEAISELGVSELRPFIDRYTKLTLSREQVSEHIQTLTSPFVPKRLDQLPYLTSKFNYLGGTLEMVHKHTD